MPGLTEQPAIGGGGSEGRIGPALELRLISGGLRFHSLAEFRHALRHRYVLANLAGLTVPAIVLVYAMDSTRMSIDLQIPAVVVGLFFAHLLVLSYLSVAVWMARLYRKDLRIVRLWMTPALVLGAAGLLGTVHIMHQALNVQQDWTQVGSRLSPILCVLYLELAATLLFRGPMPRALAKVRVGAKQAVSVTESLDARGDPTVSLAEADVETESQDLGRDLMQRLGIGLADVMRLEASGNYVTVVTRTGRHLVPGPFSAVVAQMPAALGRQVQRSHWVALHGIDGARKQGRELWLQMCCGGLVPVSAALKAEVQAWLDAQGKVGGSALRVATGADRRAGGKIS